MPAPIMAQPGPSPSQPLSTDSDLFPDLGSADVSTKQWLFSEDDLKLTPSVLNGLPMKQERQNRAKGVNFILSVGILLKLPQITLATASAFLHRFFMRYPMPTPKKASGKEFHYYSVAAASVWLAAKVEENCRKMKEVVVACVRVAQKDSNKDVDEQDKEYWRWRDTILALEDRLLEGLCFDLSLESPYKALYDIICRFDAQGNKILRNAAWAFVQDSCFAPLCVLFPSRTIAAASVYAAARSCKVEFLDEDGRPWWEIIGVPLIEIKRACNYMADVYEDAPLREGARQDLYQRTPINGDDANAKTRASESDRAAGGEDWPMAEAASSRTREGSVTSPASSTVSRKRYRGDDNDAMDLGEGSVRNTGQQPVSMNHVPWGGESSQEREAKRLKQDAASRGRSELQAEGRADKVTNDSANGAVRLNGSKGGHGDRGSAGVQRQGGSTTGAGTRMQDQGRTGAVSPELGGSEDGELDE